MTEASSKERQPVPPLRQLYVYVTGSCNLNCRHCWIDPAFEPGASTHKYLPWRDLKEIVGQAVPLGLQAVKITGGEPFMHPEICDILYGLREMGLAIRMETNATLIGPGEAKALKDNLVWFSVSLDGPTAEIHDNLRGVRGAFQQALDGIRAVREEGLGFQVITCLFRMNARCLEEMARFARELGAHSLKINPITGIARSEKMNTGGELLSVPEILRLYRELLPDTGDLNGFRVIFDVPPAFKSLKEIRTNGFGTCGILTILGILHNGRAGLCGIGEHVKELDFGELLDVGVRRVWEENAVLEDLRKNLPGNLKGICGRCMFKHYCLGKCVAQTYYEEKELFSGFSFCQEAFDKGMFPHTRIVN